MIVSPKLWNLLQEHPTVKQLAAANKESKCPLCTSELHIIIVKDDNNKSVERAHCHTCSMITRTREVIEQ